MSWLETIEKKFGKWTFPYLLPLLLAGQAMVYLATVSGEVNPGQLLLYGSALNAGWEQWYRVFTFMITPMVSSPLLFAIGLYVTWLIGSSLERQWGEFRFGLYLGAGWLATVAVALIFPGVPVTNMFIMGSLTLAFAKLFPDVEFLLFFVVPVKVKYIGWVLWGFYGLGVVTQAWPQRAMILAGVVPYVLFFGAETVRELQGRKRARAFRREAAVREDEPFHVCSRCDANDLDNPDEEFRYLANGECVCLTCLKKGESE